MPPLTRRRMLYGLAASSAIVASGCRKGVDLKYLNVVLHGLMAVAISQSNGKEGIRLIIPNIPKGKDDPGHKYLCGRIRKGPHGDCQLLEYFGSQTYYLKGVKCGTRPDLSQRPDLFYLPNPDNSMTIMDKDTLSFVLPWPDQLFTVRPMYIRATSDICYSPTALITSTLSPSDPNGSLTRIASTHVLTYQIERSGPVIADSLGGYLEWNPCTGNLWNLCPSPVANFHIYAEPDSSSTSCHAIHAFTKLMSTIAYRGSTLADYYSFNPFESKYVKFCDSASSIAGIDPTLDLETLPELRSNQGGELANCVAAFINTP